MRIGNVFVDKPCRLVLGQISWTPRTNHCMFGADLSTILPLCRETEAARIHAACLPFPSVVDAPYISGDLQLCLTHDKRVKCGWIYTDSSQVGIVYQLILEREVMLKKWGLVWLHCHSGETGEDDGSAEKT